MIKPFLKWAGGKSQLVEEIIKTLPPGKRLIEPFVGSGAVFLSSEHRHYLLGDNNQDLINLYQTLQTLGQEFIDYAKTFYTAKNNSEKKFYALRERFNTSTDSVEKSALFVYLNRHGYNGLCRYNSSGKFNVPYGRYKNPTFFADRMLAFYHKAKRTKFICADFSVVMQQAKKGDVIYCDPPYSPLSKTANFTLYSKQQFGEAQQKKLAELAAELSQRGIPVLISNHNTPFTQKVYQHAKISEFDVRRFISCKGNDRGKAAKELLALFV